ncbi:MAG: DUF3298 domain-containing protein [Lachnospiraceae bacterium]|nr:DUF3298 domain-containing protein [Lachnospiraceae bacterium]
MKKRMKKLMVPGIIMLLALGGCAAEQEKPVVEETPKAEETVEEEIEEIVEEPVEESTPVSVKIDTNQKTYYFEGTEEAYLYLQYCDVTVDGGKNDNLKRNIENWSMERSEELRSLYTSFEESATAEIAENKEFYGYTLYQTVSAARIDESVVSLLDDTYQYTGGEHGSFYRDGINFDAKTGKRLEFEEIFSDYENFKNDATERIIYQLQENYGEELFDDYIETIESIWQEELGPEWYFDGSGIVIVIQQYDVGPDSVGTPEIHLPYTEVGQYIKEAYLPGISTGVARFEKNQEIYLQLPDKTEEVPMMLQYVEKDDVPTCSLWLGDKKRTLDGFVALTKSYLVRSEDEVFCFIEVDQASDDYMTFIYRLTDGVIEQVDQVYASIDAGNMNSNEIVMEFWVDMLGTYGGVKKYYFDENNEFVTEDTEYSLHRNEFVLTTTVDLPIILNESESVLPAGSHIVLNSTDNESYVAFTIQETGQNGVLLVQRDANDYYNVSINGMNENDCFEMLPYAG